MLLAVYFKFSNSKVERKKSEEVFRIEMEFLKKIIVVLNCA
jgi:hypothetical protein